MHQLGFETGAAQFTEDMEGYLQFKKAENHCSGGSRRGLATEKAREAKVPRRIRASGAGGSGGRGLQRNREVSGLPGKKHKGKAQVA